MGTGLTVYCWAEAAWRRVRRVRDRSTVLPSSPVRRMVETTAAHTSHWLELGLGVVKKPCIEGFYSVRLLNTLCVSCWTLSRW